MKPEAAQLGESPGTAHLAWAAAMVWKLSAEQIGAVGCSASSLKRAQQARKELESKNQLQQTLSSFAEPWKDNTL
jgi:hypothetical protein